MKNTYQHLSIKKKNARGNSKSKPIIVLPDSLISEIRSFLALDGLPEFLGKALQTFLDAKEVKDQLKSLNALSRRARDLSLEFTAPLFRLLATFLRFPKLPDQFQRSINNVLQKLQPSENVVFEELHKLLDALLKETHLEHIQVLKYVQDLPLNEQKNQEQTCLMLCEVLNAYLDKFLLGANAHENVMASGTSRQIVLLPRDILAWPMNFLNRHRERLKDISNEESVKGFGNRLQLVANFSNIHKDSLAKVCFSLILLLESVCETSEVITHTRSILQSESARQQLLEKLELTNSMRLAFTRVVTGHVPSDVLTTISESSCLLFDLYDFAFKFADDVDYSLRVAALLTLQMWLSRIVKLLKNDRDSLAALMDQIQDKLKEIYALIKVQAPHMRKPINQILPDVLREYVNVTALLDPNHDWFAEFGELMSLQSRSKFIMVRAIITKMNLIGIFKSYPSLLEDNLRETDWHGNVGFLVECLKYTWQQMKDVNKWRELWVDQAICCLTHESMTVRHAFIEELLKNVCKQFDKQICQFLLSRVPDSVEIDTRIRVLRVAKKFGSLKGADLTEILQKDPSLQRGLIHLDPKIRTSTLSLVTDSLRKTELPSTFELLLLKKHLPYLMKLQVPQHRDRFLQIIQNLLTRIRDGCRRLVKKRADPDLVEAQIDFIHWFHDLILRQMYPGGVNARSQVLVMCLHALIQIWGYEEQLLSRSLFSANAVSALFFLIDDWEPNRLAAIRTLRMFPAPFPNFKDAESLQVLLQNTLERIRSSKLHVSDGGALLLLLIYEKYVKDLKWSVTFDKIEDRPQEGSELLFWKSYARMLTESVSEIREIKPHLRYRSPTQRSHGYLTFFRYAFGSVSEFLKPNAPSEWKDVAAEIITQIFAIGDISLSLHVADVTAREEEDVEGTFEVDCRGHAVFNNLENFADQQSEQLVVVSSWLGVKETCYCLSHIVSSVPLMKTSILSIADIDRIGEFFMKTLNQTKHSGVIDKARSSFMQLCERLYTTNNATYSGKVCEWLDKTLALIEDSEAAHWIRRSAGISSCCLSILKGESDTKVLLSLAMDTLFRVVVGKEWKGKVKAFNTLRIIVKDAHFSNRVLPFIDRMFQLSLVELANARWPIRNSAMLLFASLVQRTLSESRADSSSRSKTTYSSFISQYPSVIEHFVKSISVEDEGSPHPTLYPVLLLISKFKIDGTPHRDALSLQLQSHLEQCLSHEAYFVRKMAAKACCSLMFLGEKDWIESILLSLKPSMSVNLVHGLLLQIKEISSIVEISSKQASRYLQLLQTEKLWIFQTGVNLVSYHALWLLKRIEAWEFAFQISQSALESPVDRAQRAGEFYHRQLAAEIAVEAVFRLRILATELFLQLLDEEDHNVLTTFLRSIGTHLNSTKAPIAISKMESEIHKRFLTCDSHFEMYGCFCRILRLLGTKGNDLTVSKLIADIPQMYQSESQQEAIKYLGSLLCTFQNEDENQFPIVIEPYLVDEAIDDLRMAAAEAIFFSSILNDSERNSKLRIDLWCHVIHLLQDDEARIREFTAGKVCEILKEEPSLPTFVLPLVFTHLQQSFTSDMYLVGRLITYLRPPNLETEEDQFILFESERVNGYMEEAVLQLLAYRTLKELKVPLEDAEEQVKKMLACVPRCPQHIPVEHFHKFLFEYLRTRLAGKRVEIQDDIPFSYQWLEDKDALFYGC